MHNKSMNKIFLQFSKAQLLLTLCLLNIYVSAESYEAKEYIGLNNSICKNASKHLTLEDSGFFEYIGGGAEKKFECGNTVEAGNEPCRKDPELICRNINKKHILQRSDFLLSNANNFLASNKKFKNRRKLERAIKTQTQINKDWASSSDILSLISSLEREIIFTASLLPPQTVSSINNELKLKHDRKRQKILEEERLAKEASLKKQKQKQAQQDAVIYKKQEAEEQLTIKNQETEEQLTIILYLLGVFAIVVLVGVLTNKWIFFDSEKDFFMTLGLLVSATTFLYMLESDHSQNVSFSGNLFYWSITFISGALSVLFAVKTYITSIKGNGFLVGTFIYSFKIVLSIAMALLVFGKIGDIANNKDGRTSANRAPILAILALIAIFWKPIKLLLINGDKVRAKREAYLLETKNKPSSSKKREATEVKSGLPEDQSLQQSSQEKHDDQKKGDDLFDDI